MFLICGRLRAACMGIPQSVRSLCFWKGHPPSHPLTDATCQTAEEGKWDTVQLQMTCRAQTVRVEKNERNDSLCWPLGAYFQFNKYFISYNVYKWVLVQGYFLIRSPIVKHPVHSWRKRELVMLSSLTFIKRLVSVNSTLQNGCTGGKKKTVMLVIVCSKWSSLNVPVVI